MNLDEEITHFLEEILHEHYEQKKNPWMPIEELLILFRGNNSFSERYKDCVLMSSEDKHCLKKYLLKTKRFSIYDTQHYKRFYVAPLCIICPNSNPLYQIEFVIKKPWKADKMLIDYLRESGATEKKYSHSYIHSVKRNSITKPIQHISTYDDLIISLYQIIRDLSKSQSNHLVDLVSILSSFKKKHGQTVRNYLSDLSQNTSVNQLLKAIDNIEIYETHEATYIQILDAHMEKE